jgi:hypothetical protein
MKKILLPILCAVIGLNGCHSHKPKPNPAVATEVEEEFKQRWVDQRVRDYLAQGKFKTDADARQQATTDFYLEYPYSTLAQKAGMGASEPR